MKTIDCDINFRNRSIDDDLDGGVRGRPEARYAEQYCVEGVITLVISYAAAP